MKIAIIGHGNVGGALARNWAGKGHEIVIGARNLSDEKVQKLIAYDAISALAIPQAAAWADVILIATPPAVVPDLARQIGPCQGKVIIDATNSIRPWSDNYPTALHALLALTEAEVVKCFNTTGYENIVDPVYDGEGIDMFVAGSNQHAKK